MPSTLTDTPRIYVACLGCYNSGKLNGHWFDVGDDAYVLNEEIGEAFGRDEETGYLKCSDVCPHEETAIHDFEGFGAYEVDEYDSLKTLCGIVEVAEEYGEVAFALAGYESTYESPNVLRDALQDRYQGEYEDAEDFARRWHEDMGTEIPEHLQYYIDYAKMGRDMLMSDFWSFEAEGGGIHVFWH